jgi:citrate lyase subunit beta / citryl-CoA lyase
MGRRRVWSRDMRPARRPPRSLLFVPGDSERKQAKAITAGADALILDLEDSVADAQLPAARARVAAMLRGHPNGPHIQLWVRVNALSSGLLLPDLAAVLGDQASPAGIVLPKVNRAAEIEEVAYYLAALEAAHGLTIGVTRLLVITTETAEGLLSLSQFPAQFRAMPRAVTQRVAGLSWGSEDLATSLGTREKFDSQGVLTYPFQMARSICQASAAALGVQPIDTVYVNLRDATGFERELAEARRDGFTGKLVIHPDQVSAVNQTFTPTEAERERASRIVSAFKAAPEAGVINLDGQMIDRPHLVQAQRILGE